MKQIEEIVATSADFNSENVQVILCKDDTYLCILANKKVSIYFVKTGRLIGQLSDKGIVRKDIFCVWKKVEKDKSDENELVYCLTPTCILSFNPITGNVVSSINHPEFIKLPTPNDNVLSVHVTFKSPELSNQPDRIYCVVKEDSKIINNEELKPKDKASAQKKLRKHDCILTGYTTHKKKTYKFGQVNTELKKRLKTFTFLVLP